MEGYKEYEGVWYTEDTRPELMAVLSKIVCEDSHDTYFLSCGNTSAGAYINEEKDFTSTIRTSELGSTGKQMVYIYNSEDKSLWLPSDYVLYIVNQSTNSVLYDKRDKYSLSISLTIILHLCSCIMVESEVMVFKLGKSESLRISAAVIRSIMSAVKSLRVDVKAFKNAISRNNKMKDKESANNVLLSDDNEWGKWFHAALTKMQSDGMRGQEVFGHLLYCYAKGEFDAVQIKDIDKEDDDEHEHL